MRYATQWPCIANSEELAKRGLQLRSPEQTYTDSLRWMLSQGYLTPEQVPKLEK
jgi:hypothetical protein